MNAKQKQYQRETAERIVALMERGDLSWIKPWDGGSGVSMPVNAVSGRHYRGVNVLTLWAEQSLKGYRSHKCRKALRAYRFESLQRMARNVRNNEGSMI